MFGPLTRTATLWMNHRRSLAAPPAAVRNGRRTAGLLACGVSPAPPFRAQAQWQRCVGTPLTVAGAAADRQKAYRVPFSPSKSRGTVQDYVPAWRGVVK